MEIVQFLGDIDNEKIYAVKLELAYNQVYQQVLKILTNFPTGQVELDEFERCIGWIESDEKVSKVERQLKQIRVVMSLQIRQMAERKRRLADIAVGLTDRVLDEEST